jgi:phosphoglycerol transferase
LRRRTPRNALAGLLFTGVIMTGLAVQAAPVAVHHARHGSNPEVATRDPRDSEIFGMRIAQLLLPVAQHPIPAFRKLKDRYDAMAPFPGETSASSLGVVGGVGFLALLAVMLLPMREGRPRRDLWRALGVLNLFALLIATTGGFGSIFAFVVTPDIRTYARMHVFVAFLALFAAALLLERLVIRRARLGVAVCGLVLVIGCLDQVTSYAVRPYARVKAHYQKDAELVKAIEAAVPAGAMILEVPYQSFPEGGPSAGGKPLNYWPLRPYMHSRSLRWSYPAMRGRSADAWAHRIAALPAVDLVRAASDVGFDGILVHRAGFSDEGAKFMGELAAALPGATRAEGAWLSFFSLVEHNREAQAGVPPEVRAWRREVAAHTFVPRWTSGFYQVEPGPHYPFRWSSGTGVIEIENGAGFDRLLRITMEVKAATPPMTFTLGGDLPAETVTVTQAGVKFDRTLRVRPGHNTIRMTGEGAPAIAPWDPRRLIWRLENPVLEEVSQPPR